ncbi:MAG: hypothetical protein AAB395_01650 [Patescibacteria group bacterium]
MNERLDISPKAPKEQLNLCRAEAAAILQRFREVQDALVKKNLGESVYSKGKGVLDIEQELSEEPELDPDKAKRLSRLDASEAIHLAVGFLENIDDLEDSGLKELLLSMIQNKFPDETPESLLNEEKHKELRQLGEMLRRAFEPAPLDSFPEAQAVLEAHITLERKIREFYQIVTNQKKFSINVYDNRLCQQRADRQEDPAIDKIFVDPSMSIEQKKEKLGRFLESTLVRIEPDGIYMNDKLVTTESELEIVAKLFEELDQVTDRIEQATIPRLFN